MTGCLCACRSIRVKALVLGLMMLAGSANVRGGGIQKRIPKRLAMLPVTSLPQDELVDLAKVATWLEAPANGASDGGPVVEEIREQRDSFAVFAGFHTQEERSAALEATPFGEEIADAAETHDVDSLLVASVVEVESTFRPDAGSHKGAVGLMQVLPDTAGLSRAKLENPRLNLDAGAAYLAEMLARFDGNLELALAAYNAGPTNVRRYKGVPPFPETRQYVEKVLSRYVDYHRELWHASGAAALVATVS